MPHVPFAFRLLPLMTLGITGCVKIEDRAARGPGDTVVARDTQPATRPLDYATGRGELDGDAPTYVRGSPQAVIEALRNDSTFNLTVVDSSPAAAPTTDDLELLRREIAIPLAIAATSLHDTYNEMRGGSRRHEALDILAPRGTPVLSATGGRVLKLFNSKAGGLMVYATDSSEHFILMYAHLDSYQPGIAEGLTLRRGEVIGTVGTSGNASPDAPHLHFAIARSADVREWWKGAPVNPYPLLMR